jgi:glyoxylase-like metal-dependent hydrolase (beta-lactamase superfamily II)
MGGVYERVAEGVVAVDTEFLRPRLDASHLIFDAGRAAFIDTGTYFSVPNLLAALYGQDLDVDAVDYIVLTHVHLDHAGGVGRLAAALPHARVLVHPRGLAHVVDPSILAAATKAVYGEARFDLEYGEVSAVPAERVGAVDDEARIKIGRRTLEFIHTPGHALHHVCAIDRDTSEAFTGDTFGVSYRELDTGAGEFIFPTTSPSQFDPVQLHSSIDRILEYRPKAAYLTHYSRVNQVDELAADLHSDIDAFVRIAKSVAAASDPADRMKPLLFEHLSARLSAHGFTGDLARRHQLIDGDVDLNAAGLALWLARSRG